MPDSEVALALGCLLGKVFGGFWRVWRVWRVLEGFGGFGVFAGWQTAALKANRKLLQWPWGGVPDSEVALGLGCLLGKVFGGFGGFWRVWRVLDGVWRVWSVWRVLEGFGGFGVFAGWQTAALKANRKPLKWPWPWGA